MILKGLTSNNYLVEYFINTILKNVTSGSQLDVENYLNKDFEEMNTNEQIMVQHVMNDYLNLNLFLLYRLYVEYIFQYHHRHPFVFI